MAIEHACVQVVRKPWGSTDLQPWSDIHHDGAAIGELWFQRPDTNAADPALLLKLLFTTGPLSIQVHPDDAFAQSNGLGQGKTEAWYILSATPDAEVAVGLKQKLTSSQLRTSIEDGSIEGLVQWHHVQKDDVIFVPAGTIHAIGAGLVVAEIQQRSDATFRLFDHGRGRELHIDNAVAAANAGPAGRQSAPQHLTDARTLLVASPHFVLEQIDFSPKSNWELRAEFETWVLVLEGHARIGSMKAFIGEAIFLKAEHTTIDVGSDGLKGLLAYVAAEPCPGLLHNLDGPNAAIPIPHFPRPPFHDRASEARP
jgi:mannose-6-phosphate isomerase